MPRWSTCWRAPIRAPTSTCSANLSMDTLDYTGPAVNEGSKGVWLGLGDPIRELPREFRPPVPPPSDVTDVRVFCGGCLVVGRAALRRRSRRGGAAGGASGLCRLAAGRRQRRARARHPQRHELPVDDVHALRAGGRHPCGARHARAQPRRLQAAGRDRRAHEAVVPGGSVLRSRDRGAASRGAGGSTSPYGKVPMGDAERGHLD